MVRNNNNHEQYNGQYYGTKLAYRIFLAQNNFNQLSNFITLEDMKV